MLRLKKIKEIRYCEKRLRTSAVTFYHKIVAVKEIIFENRSSLFAGRTRVIQQRDNFSCQEQYDGFHFRSLFLSISSWPSLVNNVGSFHRYPFGYDETTTLKNKVFGRSKSCLVTLAF